MYIFRYEIIILTFSILFAETFPSSWKGKSRIFLSTVWITASMFLVFIYLCNLRSHLMMGIQETAPNSLEELVQTKYSHKLHFVPQALYLPSFKQLAAQGRFVPTGKYKLHICQFLHWLPTDEDDWSEVSLSFICMGILLRPH